MSAEESDKEEEEVIPPKYMTHDLIKTNLSQVGKTYDGNSCALLTLNLSGQEVCDMSPELSSYKHLRYIDLSGNKIPEIDDLQKIPHQLTLNASNNELTSLSCFNLADAFQFLQFLDLSSNKITFLTPLKLPSLTKLNLSKNLINNMDGFEGLPCLKTLNLKGNKLERVYGLQNMPCLETCNLSKNQLTGFNHFEGVPKLHDLNLAVNKIVEFPEHSLPSLPSLNTINLDKNEFAALDEVKKLLFYTTLKSLTVIGNPVGEEIDSLKKEVLILMQDLDNINGEPVDQDERDEAK